MQNVKLTDYQRPDRSSSYTLQKRYYSIHAASACFYFKSERRLKLWLGELNRQLNALAADVNCLYADVFTEYRYYYLHLNSTERGKFEQRFHSIDKTFDLLVSRCNDRASNHWTYQYAERILKLLNEINETLIAHKMNQLATVQRYRLANLSSRIEIAKQRLFSVPEGYDHRKDFERLE
jgi:hypothetical protein